MAVAQRPLNPKAVESANQQLWRHNPELRGRQLTMVPEDHEYRRQWMAAYTKALADQKLTPPTSGEKTGEPSRPCPAPTLADLVVSVAVVKDSQSLAGVVVMISGPESRSGVTSSSGFVEFRGIRPGSYSVSSTKANFSGGLSFVIVVAGSTTKPNVLMQ